MDLKRCSNEDLWVEVVGEFETRLEGLLARSRDPESTMRELEVETWRLLVDVGRIVIMYVLALRCRNATERDLKARGLSTSHVRLRMEKDYWANVETTLGPVTFPLFAYREARGDGVAVTKTPARSEILPHRKACHSSELCLEWEIRLGSDHPFRQAQEALTYFTHGAAHVEDNAISSHMVAVADLVDRSWLYRPPEELQQILRERATRCLITGRPLLFISSDAHAQRRYVNETWDARWKMANGIRVWCMDQDTGRIIHLGGEYTWGDHKEVKRAFEWLVEHQYLPRDSKYESGFRVRLVWISDGMPWFEDDIFPLFLSLVVILDAYHVLDRLAKYATTVYGKNTKKSRVWYAQAARIMGTASSDKSAKPKDRKGQTHAKRCAGHGLEKQLANVPSDPLGEYETAVQLIEHVAATRPKTKRGREEQVGLINYLVKNAYRMDYGVYRTCGYQIGSGAMESMHRTAGHGRLKVSGARWLESTSQAVFNWRMLRLVGRWDEFWAQPNLGGRIACAFEQHRVTQEEIEDLAA